MKFITNEQVAACLDYGKLIDALYEMFRSNYQMPLRHHHFYPVSDGQENTMILMPSWNEELMGIKQIILAPGNPAKGLPTVSALYTLFKVETGQPLVMMEALELTSRRTACTSALAARYLAPQNAKNLLIIGGGQVASHLAQAHMKVRNYESVNVWMRNPEKLNAFVKKLQAQGIRTNPVENLEKAVRETDVISTATLSPEPVIKGEWVKKGAHLDLIGSHKPDTREVDDEAITKSQIYVDSREGALHETGDLAIPIKEGVLDPQTVKATIKDLCMAQHPGRQSEDENTLFKSAGLAVEDLAAALVVYRELGG